MGFHQATPQELATFKKLYLAGHGAAAIISLLGWPEVVSPEGTMHYYRNKLGLPPRPHGFQNLERKEKWKQALLANGQQRLSKISGLIRRHKNAIVRLQAEQARLRRRLE